MHIDWLPHTAQLQQFGWNGRLGLCHCPGGEHGRPEYQRALDKDLGFLANVGCDLLLSLVEERELAGLVLGSAGFFRTVERNGIASLWWPIARRSVPCWPPKHKLLPQVLEALQRQQRVVIHGMAGRERAGTLAVMLLMRAGMSADDALAMVRRCRPRSVNAQQETFVHKAAFLTDKKPSTIPWDVSNCPRGVADKQAWSSACEERFRLLSSYHGYAPNAHLTCPKCHFAHVFRTSNFSMRSSDDVTNYCKCSNPHCEHTWTEIS